MRTAILTLILLAVLAVVFGLGTAVEYMLHLNTVK